MARSPRHTRAGVLAALFGVALLVPALLAVDQVAGAPAALAHTGLIGSDPAQGAVLATPPSRVVLTFSEPVGQESSAVAVLAPDGSPVTEGVPSFAGAEVTQALGVLTGPGLYTVSYRVRSLDGHRISGRRTFTYAPAPVTTLTPEPPPQASPTPESTPTSDANQLPAETSPTPPADHDGTTAASSEADSTGRLAIGFIGLVALLVAGGTGVSWARRGRSA